MAQRQQLIKVTVGTVLVLAFGVFAALAARAINEQPPVTLTVLAGSELMDVLGNDTLMDQLRAETGVTLVPTPVGTLEGAEAIVNGAPLCATSSAEDAATVACDLAWFSSNHYMELLWDEKRALDQGAENAWVVTSGETMRSPVVLGVKQATAQELGWTSTETVPWSEIADRTADGSLSFFMTNPAASNSGFSALVGVAAAFDENEGEVNLEDVDDARVSDLFSGLVKTAGSSGWLSDEFAKSQDEADAIINYESEVVALRESGQIPDLVPVFPERTVYADYPLTLLNAQDRAAYDRVVEWLREEATQEDLTAATYRRPFTNSPAFADQAVGELDPVAVPLPGDLNTAEGLIDNYLRDYRQPAHTVYVLDTSRSMEGERIAQLKQSFGDLTSSGGTIADDFTRFREGERITVVPYASRPGEPETFDLEDPEADPQELASLSEYVNSLPADGRSTAVYQSVLEAYEVAQQASEEGYYQSIVLLTDGENNEPPASLKDFTTEFRSAGYGTTGIPTFVVMLGDEPAAQEAVDGIAELSGGRVFDANRTSMSAAFKEIRGYR